MEGITIRVETDVEIDLEHLKETLVSMDYYDLLNLIKEIDILVGEWDFTKALHEYFAKEMKKYPEDEDYEISITKVLPR